jgi:serine/threonine-protein kinase
MSDDPRDRGTEDETLVEETAVERRPVDHEVIERRVRRRPPLIWPWLLLLLILVAAGIGAYVYFVYADEDTKPVPNVVGRTLDEAVAELQEEGFLVDIARENDEAEEGTVFRQDPAAGEEEEEGSTVLVGVSSGPATEPVPQVTGLSEDDARDELEEAGFEVNAVEVFSDEDEGNVVAQNPEPDTEAPTGSSVRINVSKGPGEVTVPDLVGLTEAQAKQELAELDLRANVAQVPSEEPAGTVVAQNPPAGTTTRVDELVRLNVSSGES